MAEPANPLPVTTPTEPQNPQGQQPTAEQQAAKNMVRDAATGRFAPPTPPGQPPSADGQPPVLTAQTSAPKFSPQLEELARGVHYSPEEIASFPTPGMLYDAVVGRQASMQAMRPQYQQTQPDRQPPPPPQAPPTPKFADFNLKIDESALEPEQIGPFKELVGQLNTFKASVSQEMTRLYQENAELKGAYQQSAATARTVEAQQAAFSLDQVAASVGLTEEFGKPSEAMNPTSPHAKTWQELGPLIAIRAEAQRVPEHMVDWSKAMAEGAAMLRSVRANNNGNNGQNGNGHATLPGMAPRSSQRMTPSLAPPKNRMTNGEDYEYRLAALESMFMQNGGINPLLS